RARAVPVAARRSVSDRPRIREGDATLSACADGARHHPQLRVLRVPYPGWPRGRARAAANPRRPGGLPLEARRVTVPARREPVDRAARAQTLSVEHVD